VVIPGINVYKRHLKGGTEQKAGRYDIPRPLDWSKIMLICPKCNKKTRVGFKTTPEGRSGIAEDVEKVSTEMRNLKERYQEEGVGKLREEFNIRNPMAVPKVEKVVINVGAGEATKNREIMESWSRDLATITGQKPSLRKAKVSVAAFGVRKGAPVGLKVTLRGERAFSFLEKLFAVVLPRLSDFRGVPIKSLIRKVIIL